MEVLLVEPGHRGHRAEYLAFAASLAARQGRAVRLASSPGSMSSEEICAALPEGVPREPLLRESASLRNRLRDVRALRRAYQESRFVFLHVDEYLLALALNPLFPYRSAAGIVFRPRRGVKAWLCRYLERRGMRLSSLASPLSETTSQNEILDPSGLKPSAETEATESMRRELIQWRAEGSSATPVVAVVGALDPRKSIDHVLHLAELGEIRALLVGKPVNAVYGEYLRLRCAELGEKAVWRRFARVEEGELDVAIGQADWLALLYANSVGSSGILARAARIGTPILAGGNRTVCDAVARNELGVVVSDVSSAGVRLALAGGTRGFPRYFHPQVEVAESWKMLLGEGDGRC